MFAPDPESSSELVRLDISFKITGMLAWKVSIKIPENVSYFG